MKVIKVKKNYTNKLGKECTIYQFYLELDNGVRIRIEPYKYIDNGVIKTNTYNQLSLIAYEEKGE